MERYFIIKNEDGEVFGCEALDEDTARCYFQMAGFQWDGEVREVKRIPVKDYDEKPAKLRTRSPASRRGVRD